MFQDLKLEDWVARGDREQWTMIDVRSPHEYEDATIPGSINIPIFTNEERAEIGTLYKQTSIQAAKDRGLEIVSAKLPAFIRSFAAIPGKKAVFCWRGGMRSRTTATLLSLMDVHVSRLIGGYRAYRRWVVDTLAEFEFKPAAYMLQGLTGCGKTAVLHKLGEQGTSVLDLEGLAGHRGSIFGHIGMSVHNQKTFDALLLNELLRHRDAPYVVFEAESRRIGKIALPDVLMLKREEAVEIWLELPLEARVRQIIGDYRPWEYPEACLQSFRRIKPAIHTPVAAEIERLLLAGSYERAVELLLVHYYDPRYEYTSGQRGGQHGGYVVRAQSVEEAASAVNELIRNRSRNW